MTTKPDSNHSKFWQRIQGKLILLLLTLLVPILLTEIYVYRDRLEIHRAEELQSNLEIARAVAKSFQTFIYDLVHSELMIGLALTPSQPITDRDRDRILNKFQADNPAVRSVFWVNPEGIISASSLSTYLGFDISDRTFYKGVIAGKDWVVSELISGKATGKPAFTVSRGIRDEQGRLMGIVAASIEPDRLDEIVGIYRVKGAGVSIVDNKGMMRGV
jgi:hypothetical protein